MNRVTHDTTDKCQLLNYFLLRIELLVTAIVITKR